MKLFKLYSKFFIVVALTYSILMIGMDLVTGREITLYGIVIRILIFGIGMTLTLVSFHKYQVNNTAKAFGLKNPDYEVNQKKVFVSDKTPEQIYNIIKRRSQFRKVNFHESDQIIEIKTGFSGKSWGDNITIRSKKEKENYKYQVESKPIFPLTVIDFGQNLENVLKIERYSKIAV
ncbi:hypothetical protein [Christiangramia forsetii]|uniref:Membrane protein n=2 Tax=Christiangramia forsetii TaxID=411153 RepID=A0LZR6_CHRFK|nr:hypothetical protein [Christiangramia forsetii]CAL65861.1 membrane protein [Christiangramia forsetii KT0803]